MVAKLNYYIPVYNKVTGEQKILRLVEGSTLLDMMIEKGFIERVPNSTTLRTKEKIFID